MALRFFWSVLRNIKRNKFYSFVNLTGLSIGITSCLLIVIYIKHELSYDRFFEAYDRIYRVNSFGNFLGDDFRSSDTPPPLAQTLQTEFSSVQYATHVYHLPKTVLRINESAISEELLFASDSGFFKVFNFRFLDGSSDNPLKEPNTLVITDVAAKKYFGNEPPVGKLIQFNDSATVFRVTAVVQEMPSNAHFHFNMLISSMSVKDISRNSNNWMWTQLKTYVRIQKDADPDVVERGLPQMVKKYSRKTLEAMMGKTYEEFEKTGRWGFFLQPLSRIHLYSDDISDQFEVNGSIKYLFIFSFVALLITIIACINFMNLYTAIAMGRVKEVAVKKILGSQYRSLVVHFLLEAILFTFFASLFSLVLTFVLLKPFSELSGKNLFINSGDWDLIPYFFVIVACIGAAAGIYPAYLVSRANPAEVLRGKLKLSTRNGTIGNILVGFQFTLSIGLIICTLFLLKQFLFLKEKDLGFDKTNVIVIANAARLDNMEAFKNEINAHQAYAGCSGTQNVPGRSFDQDSFRPEGYNDDLTFATYFVDDAFIKTMGINIEAGRNFSPDYNDKNSIIINKSAARLLNWEDPVGKSILYTSIGENFKVVGMVKDFNFQSLHKSTVPLIMFLSDQKMGNTVLMPLLNQNNYLLVRLKEGDFSAGARETLFWIWKNHSPHFPIEYSFLKDDFEALFSGELKLVRTFIIFTGLIILISLLGLFGLATFVLYQRRKEISIRRINGASILSIVITTSRDFIRLIALVFLISAPLSYFIVHKWLQNFAYRINIDIYTFLVSGILTLVLASVVLGFQSLKIAMLNPMRYLRENN